MRQRLFKGTGHQSGFTLLELLIVVIIISILASLLLSGLSKAKAKAQGIKCLNNTRQLMFAWHMYADDNADRLVSSAAMPNGAEWDGGGWLDFSPDRPENVDPKVNLLAGPLGRYTSKTPGIWRCPADRSMVSFQGQRLPRVRSLSMQCWMGGPGWDLQGSGKEFTVFYKMAQIIDPDPSEAAVILDEREDSIHDGCFFIPMDGYPDDPLQWTIFKYPASYHNGAGGWGFADGHAEIHKWLDPRTKPVLAPGKELELLVLSTNNVDVLWMQQRATANLKLP